MEKRAYITNAVNALEDSPLAEEARARLETIRPHQHRLETWTIVNETELRLSNSAIEVQFDPGTAEITGLNDLSTGQQWADQLQPHGEFCLSDFFGK